MLDKNDNSKLAIFHSCVHKTIRALRDQFGGHVLVFMARHAFGFGIGHGLVPGLGHGLGFG